MGHQAEPLMDTNVPGPPKSHLAFMGNQFIGSAMGNPFTVSESYLVKQISESAFVDDPHFLSPTQAGHCPLILDSGLKKSFLSFQSLHS